jgi:hypothetical protein
LSTSNGELREAIDVKPTISLKYIDASAKASGSTLFPAANFAATNLYDKNYGIYFILFSKKQCIFSYNYIN